jgi:hypothetical protein
MDDELPEETCSLHGCKLVEDVVPVIYGFFGTSSEYGRAWRELFRYSRALEPGGCSVAGGRPSTRVVEHCPICRKAEMAWLSERIAQNPDESSWEWFLAGVLGLRSTSSDGDSEPSVGS